MPQGAPQLNLELALERVRRDLRGRRGFFRHPHELALIDQDRAGWLASLRLELPTYVPGDLYLANGVKAKGAIRPGGVLSIRDQVIYAALVGRLSDSMRLALDWGTEVVDYSYPISTNSDDPDWFGRYFPLWHRFETDSIAKIDDWSQFVVFLDVAAYYECIDLGLLLSDLRAIGGPADVLDLLSKCLNKWSLAGVPGRSLPQGFSSSDILARFYLNAFDRHLREVGVHHLRYVDDIRLFARNRAEAKQFLVQAILGLRKRGLAVQTAKLGVLSAAEAKQRIEGLLPALRTILQDYVDSIAELFEVADPYFNLARAEQLLAANANNAPLGLIREAYRRYFMNIADGRFDKTLFHFLVRRLGRAGDGFAVEHALSLLRAEPQETSEVLAYIEKAQAIEAVEERLVEFLHSEDCIYVHQVYEIVAWRMEVPQRPSEAFIAFVRGRLQAGNNPPYFRAACREFLARYGTPGDIDRMHQDLLTTTEDLLRAELICSLRRMESSRRNGVISRYAGAGPYTDRALACVRGGAFGA